MSRAHEAARASAAGAGTVQRSTADGSSGAPTRVHRGQDADAASRRFGARALTHGADVYIPASAGSLESGEGRALLAHELTHAHQQRSLGSSLPVHGTEQAIALETAARRVETWAVESELALPVRRAADRPIVPTGTPSVADDTGSTPLTAAPETQAASLTPAGPARHAAALSGSVQLAPEGAASAPVGPGAAEGDNPAPTAMGERQLQELMRQIYPKLRFQLANELLVSRERAGHLTDLY